MTDRNDVNGHLFENGDSGYRICGICKFEHFLVKDQQCSGSRQAHDFVYEKGRGVGHAEGYKAAQAAVKNRLGLS